LLQLLGLLGIGDDQGVEETRAADLELVGFASLLDLDGYLLRKKSKRK
jgi:hypothetical protein